MSANIKQSDLENLIGMNAGAAYRFILLQHPQMLRCTLFQYDSPPPLQQRVAISSIEQAIIDDALKIRENTMIPFWEAVFAACLLRGECTDALLTATFFHNGQGIGTEYSRNDVAGGIFDRLTHSDQSNVALGSKVLGDRAQSWHLGLLDFHCDISQANTVLVDKVCRQVMPNGFLLLDSGDSYHATTLTLLSADERVHMLGKALLASPIVDAPYIGHQLQQDSSSIRISKGGKAKQWPRVIGAWLP